MKTILLFIYISSMITSQQNSRNNNLLNSSIMHAASKWRLVNNGVMGGISTSKAIIKDDKIIFSGNVSLENNGGFASLRSPVKDYDFSKSLGVE